MKELFVSLNSNYLIIISFGIISVFSGYKLYSCYQDKMNIVSFDSYQKGLVEGYNQVYNGIFIKGYAYGYYQGLIKGLDAHLNPIKMGTIQKEYPNIYASLFSDFSKEPLYSGFEEYSMFTCTTMLMYFGSFFSN
jgi:hypothetical protein